MKIVGPRKATTFLHFSHFKFLYLSRLLVARNDGYAANSVHTFLTHVCQETLLSSWKELTTKLSRENGGVSRTGPPPLTSVSVQNYSWMIHVLCRVGINLNCYVRSCCLAIM